MEVYLKDKQKARESTVLEKLVIQMDLFIEEAFINQNLMVMARKSGLHQMARLIKVIGIKERCMVKENLI